MAQLIVRDLDENDIAAPKARAARNGRSTEAEHRRILEDAVARDASDTLTMAEFAEATARLHAHFTSTVNDRHHS